MSIIFAYVIMLLPLLILLLFISTVVGLCVMIFVAFGPYNATKKDGNTAKLSMVKRALLLSGLSVIGLYGAHAVYMLLWLLKIEHYWFVWFEGYCVAFSLLFAFILGKNSSKAICYILWCALSLSTMFCVTMLIDWPLNPVMLWDSLGLSAPATLLLGISYILSVFPGSLVILGFICIGKRIRKKKDGASCDENAAFSMPVEDIFTIKGKGVVVTGIIQRGTIHANDAVQIVGFHNEIKNTVVAAIETLNGMLDTASVGDNVGLLLKDITSADVKKGYVIAKP